MSAPPDDLLADYLSSLEAWTSKTIRIADRIGRDTLMVDEIAQLALAKAVEQCGERCAQISRRWPDFVTENPAIEFRHAQDMRNRIAHGYDGLNLELLWFTVFTSVPRMNEAVRAALAERSSNEP